MASQVLADLTPKVERARGAMQSATALIGGFSAKLAEAIAAALANGATAEELAPLSALGDALDADASALAEAVAANP